MRTFGQKASLSASVKEWKTTTDNDIVCLIDMTMSLSVEFMSDMMGVES